MGIISLSSDAATGSSILSNIFIDYYMPEANGDFVKVYLYLLRLQQSNRQISSFSEIADHLNCMEKDVTRAIDYWIAKGLLNCQFDEHRQPVSLTFNQPKNPERPGNVPRIIDYLRVVQPEDSEDRDPADVEDLRAPAEPPHVSVPVTARRTRKGAYSGDQPTAKELNEALSDKQFILLRDEAEAFFDRPLTQKDINALWYIYKDLGLSFDLCEYLLEYCASGKTQHPERIEPDYYKKIATSWAEQGIRDRKDAKDATKRHFFGTRILRALGIRDRYMPTDAELRMFEDWRTRYGFSDEMLVLACETALKRKPRSVGYDYVEGILRGWHSRGLTTPEQVALQDQAPAKSQAKTSSAAGGSTLSTAKTGRSARPNSQKEFIQGSLADDLNLIEQLSIKKAKES